MPGKRANSPNNLLKKETFNDIQQRLERLESAIANAYKRDHQSQVLVRNNESFDWAQFTLVILNSPIPTTGPHFNESKLITASRTPDLHVYDPDLTYAVVQYTTSQVVNSVPGIGPGVVLGLTNALFVSGADDSKPYAIPTTEAGKFDTTDTVTQFKLHGIDSETNIGKIIIIGTGTAAGGGGAPAADPCCCPVGGYRMALQSDIDTLFPNDLNTTQMIVVTEAEHEYTYFGTHSIFLKAIVEISTRVLEDETIFRIRSKVTVDHPDPLPPSGNPFVLNLGFAFLHPVEPGTSYIDVLEFPTGWTTFSSIGGASGHSGDQEFTDTGFENTGTDTAEFEYVLRVNDVSEMGSRGRFGFAGGTYSTGDTLDVNWFYYPCIDGSPDTDGDGEGDGPSGGGIGL